jgi:MOSC domain-containing protein YiiM
MVPLEVAAFDEAGIEGDAHRSPGSVRSVLLEDREVLEELGLAPGQIKENVTLGGVGVNALEPGTRLRIGDAVLELTKECAPCTRMEEIRPGLQERLRGRRGVLARVVEPGTARIGDPVHVLDPEVAGA